VIILLLIYAAIIDIIKRRRSILVRSAVYQEGPKNPLKGISLKPLVFASDAQFGVDAGGKRGKTFLFALAFSGRSPMAWRTRPCRRGDLFLCGTATERLFRGRSRTNQA